MVVIGFDFIELVCAFVEESNFEVYKDINGSLVRWYAIWTVFTMVWGLNPAHFQPLLS